MTKQVNITPPVNPEPCRTTGACVSWLYFASISQPPFCSSFQLFFPKERQKRNLQLSFSRNRLWSSTWLRQSLTDGSQFSGPGYSCLRIILFGPRGVKSVPGSGVSQVKTVRPKNLVLGQHQISSSTLGWQACSDRRTAHKEPWFLLI